MFQTKFRKTGTILDDICEQKLKEIEAIRLAGGSGFEKRDFQKSISSSQIGLIAEIKKASPTEGAMRKDVDVAQIARIYEENGASAVSVVTDAKYFAGNLEWIETVKLNSTLPVLRKDFVIDESQVYESKAAGADAILLIVAILAPEQLKRLYGLARELGLDVVVEVHTHDELVQALEIDPVIIGINNRDLKTFSVNPSLFSDLAKEIPQGKIIVAESGIKTGKDVLYMKEHGANAVLVGTVFMKAENIAAKVIELRVS